jgi:hypothetical protein
VPVKFIFKYNPEQKQWDDFIAGKLKLEKSSKQKKEKQELAKAKIKEFMEFLMSE